MIEEITTRPNSAARTADYVGGSSPPASLASTRLAVHETTTYRWSFLEDVLGYRDAGIAGIGVWRPKLVEFGEERGVDLVRDAGLAVTSLSWAGGFTGANGCSFAEALDDARDAISLASRLNAGCLTLVSGSRAGHTARHARRLLALALRALVDDAAAHDVLLALQPMAPAVARQWSFLSRLDETLDLLHQCDPRRIRIAFDASALWCEPRLIERIPETVPFVATVLLNDARSAARSELDQCLPGDGQIPLREIVGAFLAADYAGPFEIGVWSEELWGSDYAELLGTCRSRFEAMCAGNEAAPLSGPCTAPLQRV